MLITKEIQDKIDMQPISRPEWRAVDTLQANMYNPNFVLDQEKKLLKFSLMKQGWIQPILITTDGLIIDGFHRHLLAKLDADVRALTDGYVPCTVIECSDADRKMLTVRINRAKGVHSAVKMHELVTSLINDDGLTVKQVCEGIGATKDEVDLLMKENVFKKLDIEKHDYSEGWVVNPQANKVDTAKSVK